MFTSSNSARDDDEVTKSLKNMMTNEYNRMPKKNWHNEPEDTFLSRSRISDNQLIGNLIDYYRA